MFFFPWKPFKSQSMREYQWVINETIDYLKGKLFRPQSVKQNMKTKETLEDGTCKGLNGNFASICLDWTEFFTRCSSQKT